MRVCVVHNPSARVKGKLRSLGVEVDTNVFALDLTTDATNDLWAWLGHRVQGDMRATLVEPATGKPGFTHRGLGNSPPRTISFDGIPLKLRASRRSRSAIFDVQT